jgi:uncharacterized protein with ParB-like and HNH nuclease domain
MTGIQDSTTNHFGSLIRSGMKFIIPKFQRDYSWDSEQWDDLWADIETMLNEGTDHYMGYLVLQTSNTKSTIIIDGQQRFTTITLIILSAIKSIQKLANKGLEVDDNKKRIETLMSTYVGNIDPISLEYDNILILNRNNNAYYKDYIVKLGDLKLRNTSYTEKLMKKCFEWFEQKINGKYSTGREYAQFIETIVENLYFTIIKVNDEMNAFRVFETLNARGVQLSSADLLKNYLFSLVDNTSEHPERVNIIEEKWTKLTTNVRAEKLPDFIRYYWNSKNKTVRSNDLFKVLRNNIKEDRSVFELINDMLAYSDIYMALKNESDDLWNERDKVQEYVSLLNIFNLKQPISMLMAAYKYLSNEDFERVLCDAIVVSFRYNVICGKNPNDIEKVFNDIAIKISNNNTYDKNLLSKIYVNDNEFTVSFINKVFPENARNNKIIKYILGKYERFKGGLRDVSIVSELDTIEHIYPQHPNEEWNDDNLDSLIYRLGNMCLLEKKLNNNIGNKRYAEKVEVLNQSTFITTNSISSEYPEWVQQSIVDRQKQMAKCAKTIWKITF